jgi:hypothetical protein
MKNEKNAKRDSMATLGVEDSSTISPGEENPKVVKMSKDKLKDKKPLETPTFFSIQRD